MKYLTKILGLFMLVTAGCSHESDDPGWDFFPDMAYSNAYETYSENPVLKDGKTMQEPVAGTVPTNYIPYQLAKTDADREKAGKMYIDTLAHSEKTIQRGKEAYNIYCIDCHGDKGDGKGFLFTSGKYPYPPASLISDKIKSAPDGEIYHVITVGWGIMGAHGALVRPDDRWKIIHYIRETLQK